ncbi:aminopeptidase N [Nocardioidaceae bacterium]|nr:aminopeptidase N [Nocardioidaceae bacterium]
MPSLTRTEAEARAALLQVGAYDITLDLDRGEETFSSTTRVTFTAARCDAGATFLDVKPRALHRVRLDGRDLDLDGEHGLVDGRIALPALGGEHELVVEAEMAFRTDGEGLHRAVDPADGRHYVYGMSFMDAAPSWFACFDQPDLKAPYTLHVTAPADWVVRGNGHAEHVAPGRWELDTTPPLSTYFTTLVAGPYHLVEDSHDGIALGLSARASLARELERDAEEILTITRQCFDRFHELFDVRYAFGDYHQAFVPEFNAGAMENPGCVTFRDPMIFTSQVTRSEHISRATTIAHEMAHQWFGDLVTPRWWDDLWLNESFAEYMGNRVTAEATTYDDAWVQTAFRRRTWGLVTDQGPATHPVAGNGAPDALAALADFDGISYVKGSSALRQLAARLGDEAFLGGVRRHFAHSRFGNARMADLVAHWEAASGNDLTDWVTGWLRTAGVDEISYDRDAGLLRRTPPREHPAEREHQLHLAAHDGTVWRAQPVTVTGAATPVEVPPDAAVVPDSAEETWARVRLDRRTRDLLPTLLPATPDPLLRAVVWNAVRDGLHNAVLGPAEALDLLERALPHEADDAGVAEISRFALERVLPWSVDPEDAARRLHTAAMLGLGSAGPGTGRQLALAQTAVATAPPSLVHAWLDAVDVPRGLTVDRALRWRLLVRGAVLGELDQRRLDAALDEDPAADARVEHARARASLPTAEAKQWAWRRVTGEVSVPNYELTATGQGFWRPSQRDLTDAYVPRYLEEVGRLQHHFQGWLLPDAADAFFPSDRLDPQLVDAVAAGLDHDDLDPAVARRLRERLDVLRRGVAARAVDGL